MAIVFDFASIAEARKRLGGGSRRFCATEAGKAPVQSAVPPSKPTSAGTLQVCHNGNMIAFSYFLNTDIPVRRKYMFSDE